VRPFGAAQPMRSWGSCARPAKPSRSQLAALRAHGRLAEHRCIAGPASPSKSVSSSALDRRGGRLKLAETCSWSSRAAVAALGIVALVRTEIRDTWYTPVVDAANINHVTWLADVARRAGRDRSGVPAGGGLAVVATRAAQSTSARTPAAEACPSAVKQATNAGSPSSSESRS
jgi:hypothetical protein